jgi:uncharacterized integral membrane protein
MQVLIWLIFLIALGIAIFAVQNSNAPLVIIKFLFWKFETSLVYTILGSVGLGILLPVLSRQKNHPMKFQRIMGKNYKKHELEKGDYRKTKFLLGCPEKVR